MLKPKKATPESSDRSLQQQIDALDKERLDWETKRHEQMMDLKEQSRLLADAWQRLEQQQRAVMQTRGTNMRETNAPAANESSPPAVLSSTLSSQNQKTSSPSAIEQFRLLQRDVQAHQLPNIESNRTPGESS